MQYAKGLIYEVNPSYTYLLLLADSMIYRKENKDYHQCPIIKENMLK